MAFATLFQSIFVISRVTVNQPFCYPFLFLPISLTFLATNYCVEQLFFHNEMIFKGRGDEVTGLTTLSHSSRRKGRKRKIERKRKDWTKTVRRALTLAGLSPGNIHKAPLLRHSIAVLLPQNRNNGWITHQRGSIFDGRGTVELKNYRNFLPNIP